MNGRFRRRLVGTDGRQSQSASRFRCPQPRHLGLVRRGGRTGLDWRRCALGRRHAGHWRGRRRGIL